MAGTAPDRELSRVARARFAVATEAEEVAIRRLLRENPMPGAVSLTLEREPDYFRGSDLAGADDQTIVAFSHGKLACMGRCSRRACWIDGQETRVGYLAELRLDASVRGEFHLLRDGYRFFQELQHGDVAEVYFTSIGAENERARRLLERGVRGMPVYSFLAELATLLVAVPRRSRRTRIHGETATQSDIPGLLRVLNDHARRHQLAAVWTAEMLHDLEKQGLPLERFLLVREGGVIVACGALWDQRGFRQTVIQGYARTLAAARPLVNLASRVLGTPRLPRAGDTLSHAFLSPLAFTDGAEAMLPDFIEAFFPVAAQLGLEFLTLALPMSDPRLPAVRRRFSTRTWPSRLYRVDWPEQTPFRFHPRGAAFLPDVALL